MRSLRLLAGYIAVWLLSAPVVAQVCTQTIVLRDTACAGTATCSNKGSALTWYELDDRGLNQQDMCDWIDTGHASTHEDGGADPIDSISAGDSGITMADPGAGTATVTIDSSAVAIWDVGGLTIGGSGTDGTLDVFDADASDGVELKTSTVGGEVRAVGSDANLRLDFYDKGGSGSFRFYHDGTYAANISSAGLWVQDVAGTTSLGRLGRIAPSLTVPSVMALNADGDTGLGGTADNPCLIAGGVTGLCVPTVPSAVNYAIVTPSATGNGIVVKSEGTDTNIDIKVDTAGTGHFGTINDSGNWHGFRSIPGTNPEFFAYRDNVVFLDWTTDSVGVTFDLGSNTQTPTRISNDTSDTGAAHTWPMVGIYGGRTNAPTSGTEVVGVAIGRAYPYTQSFAPASGAVKWIPFQILTTINQSGTATGNYTAFEMDVTETNFLGSTGLLADWQVGGASKFSVDNAGNVSAAGTIVDAIGEIDATLRSGIDSTLVTGTLATTNAVVLVDANDDLVEEGNGLTWNVTPAGCTGDGNGGCLTVVGTEIQCSADDGGAGGQAWTTITDGVTPATADTSTDTFTVTDSSTIDFVTSNDPEDLTGSIVANSIDETQLAATITFASSDNVVLPIEAADQTVDGEIDFDTTEEVIEVGDDGVATLKFYPGAHSTECASASCNLNAATTLNSQNVCLANDTNCPSDEVGVLSVADGTGIDGTAGEGGTYTPTLDLTEMDSITWSDNAQATVTQTVDTSGATDVVWTYTDGNVNVSTGNLQEGGVDVSTGAHTADQVGTVTDGSYCQGGAASVLDCDVLQANIPGANHIDSSGEIADDTVTTADIDDASDTPVEGEIVVVGQTTTQVQYAPFDFSKTMFDTGNIADTDDIRPIHVFGNAAIVTDVDCITAGGTSATITLEDGGGTDLVTGCVCSTTLTNCTLAGGTTFTADEELDIDITAVSGSVTTLTFSVEYRYDM